VLHTTEESERGVTGEQTTEINARFARTHAEIIAERNDCKWCGGRLDGDVEVRSNEPRACVVCADCGNRYL
jgi:hypothetical protein